MASLNLSTNGPSITNSYQKIVNAAPASGAAANSPTYAQWALFSVQAPLVSAFQQDGGKESVLKVQTTGEGELVDLVDEFSDGRIQFAFVKVKDQNTGLPKNVLVAWCGEGVPERTKGYFTSHMNAVSKLLHGYHVQVTARSEQDLTPEGIVQKVADSSGSKYGGGSSMSSGASAPPPPVVSKPAMPTKSFGTSGFQPLGGRGRAAPQPAGKTDEDGWGEDAPPVTRTQLEKVGSAYQPTKVDMASLQSQREPSKYQVPEPSSNGSDVVRGGYQPVGKVDINAIRKQAQEQGSTSDDRPTAVKGSYEPVGKVDIADIRRKAQAAPPPSQPSPPPTPAADEDEKPKSLAERSAAFASSERITSMPKPKVSNRFGSNTNSFVGTKAPTPADAKPSTPAAPVGAASRTFADQGGKTPAQQWAERKARERGDSGAADTSAPSPAAASPVTSQQSGGWQSGYEGKKWGVQMPTRTGGSGISEQRTGADEPPPQVEPEREEENERPSGGVGSIRDRFKEAPPMGAPAPSAPSAPSPPPLDTASKPNAGASRGVPIPGLPPQPPAADQADDQAVEPSHAAEERVNLPPPPPRPQPADEQSDSDSDMPQGRGSPVPLARPVPRDPSPAPVPRASPSPPPMPTASLSTAASATQPAEEEPQIEAHDPARAAGQNTAESSFGQTQDTRGEAGGKEAIAQYDYEKAEENELELREGERVLNIDMVDEDWWMGENTRGEKGLFPSNYVELVESQAGGAGAGAPPMPAREESPPPAAPAAGGAAGKSAVAQYDYEAAEENELSFPDGGTITGVEFPDDDWWFGHYGGKSGLFPANYVELNP